MNLQIDLRDVSPETIVDAIQKVPRGVRLLITAWQWSLWKKQAGDISLGERATVMVPDFLHYARLAGTGKPKEILELPGSIRSVAVAAAVCAPAGVKMLPGLATGQFWTAAEAMMRYDTALLGRRFPGEIVLHYNLTDFACFFDRIKLFRQFAAITKNARNWGFATQQVPALISLCSRSNIIPGRLLYPTGMSRPETLLVESAMTRQFIATHSTIDFTQWPAEILSAADLYDFSRPYDDTWLVSRNGAAELL